MEQPFMPGDYAGVEELTEPQRRVLDARTTSLTQFLADHARYAELLNSAHHTRYAVSRPLALFSCDELPYDCGSSNCTFCNPPNDSARHDP